MQTTTIHSYWPFSSTTIYSSIISHMDRILVID